MEKWRGSLVVDLGEEDGFFFLREEGLRLFGQLRGNLVREKKGRVSAGGGALCPAAWWGQRASLRGGSFFFK
jgi:hypothetical protein